MSNWPEYYCPVSARLGKEDNLLQLSAQDAKPKWFEEPSDAQIHTLSEIASAFVPKYEDKVTNPVVDISDACCAGFELSSSKYLLISWEPFSREAAADIWMELMRAVEHSTESGVQAAALPHNHLAVMLDYRPDAAKTNYPEMIEQYNGYGQFRYELDDLHNGGLVHGGINERWINTSHGKGRCIFGVGLSTAYSAWRSRSLTLGNLVGDPRYASARELAGEAPCAAFDRHALAALMIAFHCSKSNVKAAKPWRREINGPDAFLSRAPQGGFFLPYARKVQTLNRLITTFEEALDTAVSARTREKVARIVSTPPASDSTTDSAASPILNLDKELRTLSDKIGLVQTEIIKMNDAIENQKESQKVEGEPKPQTAYAKYAMIVMAVTTAILCIVLSVFLFKSMRPAASAKAPKVACTGNCIKEEGGKCAVDRSCIESELKIQGWNPPGHTPPPPDTGPADLESNTVLDEQCKPWEGPLQSYNFSSRNYTLRPNELSKIKILMNSCIPKSIRAELWAKPREGTEKLNRKLLPIWNGFQNEKNVMQTNIEWKLVVGQNKPRRLFIKCIKECNEGTD